MTPEMLLYILAGLGIIMLILILVLMVQGKSGSAAADVSQKMLKEEFVRLENAQRDNTVQLGKLLMESQKNQSSTENDALQKKLSLLQDAMSNQLKQFGERMDSFSAQTGRGMEGIRTSVEQKMTAIQNDNNRKLDEMRGLVDEKLQKTINERMTESFKLVNERLEQVYKGLGEMQTLAQGVGDLKKVLGNVKTRGILGEVQLGAILEDILTPDQYEKNIATVPGSRNVVEYAVKLPTENGGFVYLPIDAKFPGDSYAALRDAYDSGTPEEIRAAVRQLTLTIRAEARDIHEKYIASPHTTEFGILFLPFEGLYAEAVSRGMVETLQREYRVNLAGPSTMAALLNSLQMSFRTIAIQRRSGEVWNILGAVRTEFDKFADALSSTQSRLDQASRELDQLVGVRTRQMQRRLRSVESLSEPETAAIFPALPDPRDEDGEES